MKKLEAKGIFSALDDDVLEAFARTAIATKVRAGEWVKFERDYLFCVLSSGEFGIYVECDTMIRIREWDAFGSWALAGLSSRRFEIKAMEDSEFCVWHAEDLVSLMARFPEAFVTMIRRFGANFGERMDAILQSRSRNLLPSQRSTPEIKLQIAGEEVRCCMGSSLMQLLPAHIDGYPVVAALVNNKPVSLNRPLMMSGNVVPVTTQSVEGRAIFRQSLDLLLIEAAHRVAPELDVRIGPSMGFAHLIEVENFRGMSKNDFAVKVEAEMRKMIAEDVKFQRNYWSTEDAREIFLKQRWDDAVHMVCRSRTTAIALVTCGEIFAIELSPYVPGAGILNDFQLVVVGEDVLMYFSESEVGENEVMQSVHSRLMARQHDQWLKTVGITSAGAFNDMCISGDVAKIIRVSEGFHEKRIGQIADMVAAREKNVRVICISGPSSSGKTTFLKRLSTQLQVVGLTPKCISLDNYYVNRELTVKDENGDYDFEAFEALNIELLHDQISALISGRPVKLARYDFPSGINHPDGGPEIQLGATDVLLLEGIHALNPGMPISDDDGVFRIFINPMTSLPIDRASRVSASDIRLIRRIVRDRYQRSISAQANIDRWPSVRRGELKHIFPYQKRADAVFNTSLVYEISVLKVYADRYLLEVDENSTAYATAYRLRRLIDKFVSIYPDHVPQTSLLREFIGGSSFGD